MTQQTPDMNRDPITGTPGSHPLGTGVGATGGAAAGAMIGAVFGPIGMLVGGTVGAVAGGLAGHGVAERLDPTAENEYWRENAKTRPYFRNEYDYDTDYSPAYRYGTNARSELSNRPWDPTLENDLRDGWDKARGESRLSWDHAKEPVRDAWDRSDRTYRSYEDTDRHFQGRHQQAGAVDPQYDFDTDYRPAYRYGTFARSQHAGRQWDESLERDLEGGWERARGGSRLSWAQAKQAVRESWNRVESALPGDADRDGR